MCACNMTKRFWKYYPETRLLVSKRLWLLDVDQKVGQISETQKGTFEPPKCCVCVYYFEGDDKDLFIWFGFPSMAPLLLCTMFTIILWSGQFFEYRFGLSLYRSDLIDSFIMKEIPHEFQRYDPESQDC